MSQRFEAVEVAKNGGMWRWSGRSGRLKTPYTCNELSPIEAEEREFHERVIHDAERGKKKLTEIQLASLKVLFDNKLYRSTHKTFPEYCKATFDFEKAYSYFQIGFAQVRDNLSTRVDFLPDTEYQSRPLAALESPELQAQAWTQAQVDSGKEQPSNREVAEAVAGLHEVRQIVIESSASARVFNSRLHQRYSYRKWICSKWRYCRLRIGA